MPTTRSFCWKFGSTPRASIPGGSEAISFGVADWPTVIVLPRSRWYLRCRFWSTTTSSGLSGSAMRPSINIPAMRRAVAAVTGMSPPPSEVGLAVSPIPTKNGYTAFTSGSAATARRFAASNDGSFTSAAASGACKAATYRGSVTDVRRAPASPAPASPRVVPASSPSTTHAGQRVRSSDRAQSHAAVTQALRSSRTQPTTAGSAGGGWSHPRCGGVLACFR